MKWIQAAHSVDFYLFMKRCTVDDATQQCNNYVECEEEEWAKEKDKFE